MAELEVKQLQVSISAVPTSKESTCIPSTGEAENLTSITTFEYPAPLQLFILLTGVSLALILVALDRTIIATAIPRITDDFNSPGDVGWYASAYLILSCAFQPIYGQIYTLFDIRWSFLIALGLFEAGSLICGVAQSSDVLIVGRAIAGIGCSGIFVGAMVIISVSATVPKRPMLVALVGSLYGLGSVAGPLVGGALTEKVNWRWCFFINLPVGGVTIIALMFYFRPPPLNNRTPLLKRFKRLDFIGSLLLLGSAIQFLLALQWGGTSNPWSSPLIVGLLCGSGGTTMVFIEWQRRKGTEALVPLEIVMKGDVPAALGAAFFLASTTIIHAYFLPIWFQVVRGDNPNESGIHLVPYVVGLFFCSIVAGITVTKTGYYNPPALIGPVISVIGCGMLTTLRIDTPVGKWVGWQILAGGGIGAANQQGYMAIQTTLPQSQASVGLALVLFVQSLGGSIFASVGNNILRNGLIRGLSRETLPGVDIQEILRIGVTDIRSAVPHSVLSRILAVFNDALRDTFIPAVPLVGLAFVCALGLKWVNIKAKKSQSELLEESSA